MKQIWKYPLSNYLLSDTCFFDMPKGANFHCNIGGYLTLLTLIICIIIHNILISLQKGIAYLMVEKNANKRKKEDLFNKLEKLIEEYHDIFEFDSNPESNDEMEHVGAMYCGFYYKLKDIMTRENTQFLNVETVKEWKTLDRKISVYMKKVDFITRTLRRQNKLDTNDCPQWYPIYYICAKETHVLMNEFIQQVEKDIEPLD